MEGFIMLVQFREKDIVNNGFATYRVLKDHGSTVAVVRIDFGSSVCVGTAKLDKELLSLGDIRKMEIDFV